ncbi:MAG: hypothetical protein K9W43_05025 [Candidatus Thorarchaeota archaeon]|nr:hypothetical protein [Candidatus Thorarchaeota archaeon]
MPNTLSKKGSTPKSDITVYTKRLYTLNKAAQEAVREFSQHDIDDEEGLEKRRIKMHDAFTKLYDELANFSENVMGVDFDIAYLRERIKHAEGETKAQLEKALTDLETELQNNLADIWMARVMSWLHQAAAASGPFSEEEHEDKEKAALQHLAQVYTMLEKSFSAIPVKTDGTQQLRRVALGKMIHQLIKESGDKVETKLDEILGKNNVAEAEFYDEFLNELIGYESTFRQAFNPFDELVWRDILYAFIYEQATDLYNGAIPTLKKAGAEKSEIEKIKSWKANTSGLAEVYFGMTYNDIANAQMRAGNLEDAAKLYQMASDSFGRAEKCFSETAALEINARQAQADKDHNKAQALFCKAEATVGNLTDLLKSEDRDSAITTLKDIFKSLRKAEKLSKSRELTGAIRENLRIFAFIEDKLKKNSDSMSGIIDQIDLAKSIRREGLVQDINKAIDSAVAQMESAPSDALVSIREGLTSLGILLSLQEEDDEIRGLRNRTIAVLKNLKYVIQFQLSGQLQQGIKFMVSRILENLHAEEAAEYYQKIGAKDKATELRDFGRLAVATSCASEAQVFAKQSEQWAFRTQLERASMFNRMEADIADMDINEDMSDAIKAHDNTIERIQHAVAAFEASILELQHVAGSNIRLKNNVDAQIKQLQGVVMKFKGDLMRLQAAKSNFLGEFASKKGDKTKARTYFTEASDKLREAVGNYTVAAQTFQAMGNMEAAQSVGMKAKTADLLARSVWDSKQKISRDEEPTYFGDTELAALYLGAAGQ